MNRLGFIGGSDTVQIMQGNWLELWQIKTGRIQSPDLSENIAVQLGSFTEDFNLRWFEKQNNVVLGGHQSEYQMDVDGVPVKGTVDATLNDLAIVEAKHTNPYKSMEDVIEYYMPQIQTYVHISGCDGCYLSVIFGNSRWESAYIAYDQNYFQSMWAVVADFWRHVTMDIDPVGYEPPKVGIDSIQIDGMVRRDASKDNAFVDMAHTYVENEAYAKSFESAKKSLKDMVARNEREVYCDILSVKRDKRGALRFTTRTVKENTQ